MKNILQTFFFYKKEVSYGCMYLIKNTVTLSNIRTILMNCFLFESILNAVYFCDQSWIFRIITVFSVNLLLKKHLLLLLSMLKPLFSLIFLSNPWYFFSGFFDKVQKNNIYFK